MMVIATVDNHVVGLASVTGSPRPRVVHNVELGISVKQQYWKQGIGSQLLISVLDLCKQTNVIRNIKLIVRSDNQPEINLYEKFDFKYIGTYTNSTLIDGKYYDTNIMKLDLNP